MIEKINHNCTTNEVSTISVNILTALRKMDWTNEEALTALIALISEESAILEKTLRVSKGGSHSKNLLKMDEVADKTFICVKQFVWANIFDMDEKRADAATAIWAIFTKHDLHLHRRSYEAQMSLTKTLVDNLNEPEPKLLMEGLTGVAPRFKAFANASDDFRTNFSKYQEDEAGIEALIAPSSQKNVVRKLVNDRLLTYLDGVSVALPEKYGDIIKIISNHIVSANTKARSRKTRNENEKMDVVVK
jgi:hypothetical protein